MINRILLIMLLLCFLCMGGMYWHISELQVKVENLGGYKSMYEAGLQKQDTFTDKNHLSHDRTQEVELTYNTLKNVIKEGDPDLTRIMKEIPKINKSGNNLESFNSIIENSETNFKTPLRDTTIIEDSTPWDDTDNKSIDTIRRKAKEFEFKNKWDTYKGIIYNDSAFVIRDGKDSLDIAAYWVRKWFLGAKTYEVEAISLNPETKIISVKSITVKRKGAKKKKWRSE